MAWCGVSSGMMVHMVWPHTVVCQSRVKAAHAMWARLRSQRPSDIEDTSKYTTPIPMNSLHTVQRWVLRAVRSRSSQTAAPSSMYSHIWRLLRQHRQHPGELGAAAQRVELEQLSAEGSAEGGSLL
jgi:3-methyladenine DNA glycosylase/8-oxoguanine DNA glycosylase